MTDPTSPAPEEAPHTPRRSLWREVVLGCVPVVAAWLFWRSGSWLWWMLVPLAGIVLYGPRGDRDGRPGPPVDDVSPEGRRTPR